MAEDKEDREGGGFHNQNPNPNHNNNISKKGSKGKSCKGCLYYSSLQRSKSKNPTCVGIPRTLHQGQSLYNPSFYFLIHWFLWWCLWVCLVAEKIKEIWKKILGFLFCAVFAYSSLNFDGVFFALVVMILISLSGSLRWFLVLDALYVVGWCKVLCLCF